MIDVTDRAATLRRATAEAIVTMRPETIDRIRAGEVPKGDVAAISRAAGMLGLKRTPELLPFCHVIPIGHAEVRVTVEHDHIRINVEVATIARTGVEVEAMTGAAVAALNVYDMVKPIDKEAAIGGVRVISKSGGRSQWREQMDRPITGAVLVVSDSVAAGTAEDSAGRAVVELLTAAGVEVGEMTVVPDEPEGIAARVEHWTDEDRLDLVFVVGGTGLGPRDRTPEAIRPLLEREIPGIAEAVRSFGRERTPLAALSRAVAGQRGSSVIVAVAGSTRAASEATQALMPWLVHAIKVFDAGYRHDR